MFKAKPATNFEQTKVAFGTLIGDAASRSGLEQNEEFFDLPDFDTSLILVAGQKRAISVVKGR